MPLYNYRATDAEGKKRTGSVDARSQELAVNLLKSEGLFVAFIEEKRSNIIDDIMSFRGIPSSDVVSFTRQFSTMISSGLPISRALEVLTDQTENKAFRNVLYDILKLVEGGLALSNALEKYPNVFSTTYCALIQAGESSGKLPEILVKLADKMEAQRELEAKFKGAMIYPVIVVIAMIGVFFMLMIFVIPKLSGMYASMNVPLPLVTRLMIATSNFMVNNVIIMLIMIAGFILMVRSFVKSEFGRNAISDFMFVAPVFGKINKMKDVAQFTSTLSLLLASAVPIVDALTIVSQVVNNRAFKKASLEAAQEVEKGRELSEYFRSNPVFPPLISQMASVGQETGKMDEVLNRVSIYFESEVDHLVKGLSAAMEPIILVMLGSMVGFLIISIITPIYKITSSI